MRKMNNKSGKKFTALMLALALAVQPMTTVPFSSMTVAEAAEEVASGDVSGDVGGDVSGDVSGDVKPDVSGDVDGDPTVSGDADEDAGVEAESEYVDLEAKSETEKGILAWADGSTGATFEYDGTSATINAGYWGQQDWWSVQWAVQEMDVTAGDWNVEFDIVSTVDKPAYFKLTNYSTIEGADVDTPIIESTMGAWNLKANETEHYSQVATIGADGQVRFFFNLGGGADAGSVTISNVKLTKVVNYIDLEAKSKDENGILSWADGSTGATFEYDGTSATINAGYWGQQDWWSVQWAIQEIDVTPGVWNINYDIVSTVDKPAYFKLTNYSTAEGADVDTPIVESTMGAWNLTANEVQHYSQEAIINTDGQVRLFFNLGGGADAGSVTISNVEVTKASTVPDVKGQEYDFSDVSGNAENDIADPGTSKDGYDLIWSDEFDGSYAEGANIDEKTGLNLDNWTPQNGDGTCYSNPGWGNAELQAYSGRPENVGVNEDINGDGKAEGVLRITAAYEEDGYDWAEESTKSYTSARLHSTTMTEQLFNTTYGYVEARISLPQTKGAWPAFWMLPQSTSIYGGWPVSGEIDIMESTGTHSNEACGTLHRGTPGQIYSGSGYVTLDSEISYFHTYAIDWEPGKITWYFDGKKIHEEKNWESAISGASGSLAYDAPFDQPFYVLLNLAIDSGRFGGAANAATFQEDINMYVDYVRVYQREDGYADSVVREATSTGTDWKDYAGINQIGTVAADTILDSEGNLHAMETDGTVDSTKWYLACTEGGEATVAPYTDDAGKEWAKVSVNTAGGQDYSVQLIGHYNAKAGYVYKISYDAYAAGDMIGTNVSATSTEWKTWGKYGRNQFTLTGAPVTSVAYIEQTADFDTCRIEFNLGAVATGDVYIGNVKVEIVDPAEYGTEGGNRTPLSNGDVIYNGTFSEGNNRLGYWRAGADSTVVVPRYTTKDLTGSDVSVVDVASTINDFEPEAKANNGVKYYERRAQISAKAGVTPSIYQPGIPMPADEYTLKFEMYSETDTTVTAAIYTADEDGVLGAKVLASNAVAYAKDDKVKEYTWKFTTAKAIENAALVLIFADGTSVQIDDVTMIGASQKETIDETPVDADSTWSANTAGAAGATANDAVVEDGVVIVSGITSDAGAWYTPQITSSQFKTAAGTEYMVSAKIKLEGTSNNKVKYIIQNQGSWEVVQDVVEIDLTTLGDADEDGFYTYETTFTCGGSYDSVAFNWGLGHSEASDATFSFKDVTMTAVVDDESGEDEGGSDDSSMDTGYENWDGVDGTKPEQPGTKPEQPSTQAPTTQAPTTEAPKTEQPTTEAPKTETPAVGTTTTVSGGQYKVTSSTAKEVTYVKPVNNKKASVTIPATVTISGEKYKVTAIANNAFKNNKKIKSVTIGKNVKKIGKQAFYKCKSLKKITIKSTVLKSVGKNAIKGINSKATIKVPKKQYSKYKKLFKSKTGYKKSMKIKK